MYLVLQFSEFLWPKGKCTKNFCTNRFHLESAMYIYAVQESLSYTNSWGLTVLSVVYVRMIRTLRGNL